MLALASVLESVPGAESVLELVSGLGRVSGCGALVIAAAS